MIQVITKYGQLKVISTISYTSAVTDVTASLPLLSSGGSTPNISLGINSITNNYFRQSLGLSVVGRSINSPGNVADIVAGSDFTILRRSGTTIGFGGLTADFFGSGYSDNYVLTTDALGNLTWSPGGGTPVTNGFLGQAYVVWTGVGYVYDVFWPQYIINGVTYPAGSDQVTLDAADPTNPRIDLVGVDALGVIVLTGTPAVDPVQPTLNPETQLEITTIIVLPGSTEPVIDSSLIYNEDVEWATTSNNGLVDFASTSDPLVGLINIDAPAMVVNQFLQFENATELEVVDYTFLRFYINLKGTWNNNNAFSVRFLNGGVPVSNTVTVQNGVFNFSRTIINTYQTVAIPLSNFTFTSGTFDQIVFTVTNSLANGFKMDYIQLLGGGGGTNPLQNNFTTIITDTGSFSATQPNDIFKIEGAGGIVVTNTGKTITVDASSIIPNIPWTEIIVDQTLELNKKYLTNNATKLVLTLPVDNTVRTVIVASKLGGWKLQIPVGWEILIADEVVTDYIESTLVTDTVELLSLGNNKYSVIELKGNIIFNNL